MATKKKVIKAAKTTKVVKAKEKAPAVKATKGKKIIVVGLNHAGTTAVRTARNLNKDVNITGYDMNDNISFLGCGIAIWVKGDIKDPKSLFYANEQLLKEEKITVKMKHKVTAVDSIKKIVHVTDLTTGKEFTDNYDELILATGSWPIIPQIKGTDLTHVYISKWYQHANEIVKANSKKELREVTIVGAGYIGIELAEAFHSAGHNVTLMDKSKTLLGKYFDKEISSIAMKELEKNGVKVMLNTELKELKSKDGVHVSEVVTDKGKHKADIVILAIGFKATLPTIVGKPVKLNERGMVEVDQHSRTSVPNIYAIGDCTQVYNNAYKMWMPMMLATTAVRTGVIAAVNALGVKVESLGFQGSNAIQIFNQKMASVGVTEEAAQMFKIDVEAATYVDNDLPEFMEGHFEKVTFKVIWDKKTKEIIGAQVCSVTNHTELIHMFSLAIMKKLKITELALVDMFFLPHFNKPYNFVTQIGLDALGLNYMSNKKKK